MTFNLDKLDIKIDKKEVNRIYYSYNGKKYLYKRSKRLENCYNELIAEKIAKKLNIPCSHYIYSTYEGFVGVSSELFDTSNFVSMKELFKNVYGKVIESDGYEDLEYYTKNDLESIWNALKIKCIKEKIPKEKVKTLMTQIIKIFMFDMLIANSDRHTDNLGLIITNNSIEVAKIFDNEEMLSEYGLYDGEYCIKVEEDDYEKSTDSNPINIFEKFFNISASEYEDTFKKMLELISDENIEEIFKELENEEVPVNEEIKEKVLSKFKTHRDVTNRYFFNKSRRIK